MVVQSLLSNNSQSPAPSVPWEIHQDNAQGALLASGATDPIAAGASTVISATFDTAALTGSSVTIYVVADPQQVVPDSDRSNNTSTATFDVLPDIAVQQGSGAISGGSVTVTIANIGVRQTGAFAVTVAGDNAAVLGTTTAATIQPGAQADLTIPIDTSQPYSGLTVTANPDGAVAEMRTDNNSTFIPVSNYNTVATARNLADGTQVSLPSEVITGSFAGSSTWKTPTERAESRSSGQLPQPPD